MEVPRWLEIALAGTSVVMCVGSAIAVPWAIRKLPADHFVRPPQEHSLATRVVRNALGALLVAVGIAMLVLPGQGIIAILVGLSIMDLQVKARILRRLLCQKKIQRAVQRIRASAGKQPLVIPAEPVNA